MAGARAHLRGIGTINGAGDYAFSATVDDGRANGRAGTDRFRIRIWERATGTVVYDNNPAAAHSLTPGTELRGGNIVVHLPKT